MRDIFYITLFSLLITACDATYRVKRDLDVARPLQRTCVEDQVYSNLNDAFTRFEEINNEKHWKFSWIYKYRLSGEITQRSKPDGTMTIDINSSGVIAPSSPKEFEAEVAAQLDKLVSAIKSNCHLENVHVKKLSK